MSEVQSEFLKKYKRNRFFIRFMQVFIVLFLLVMWEVCARGGVVNSFISSSPIKIFNTIFNLFRSGVIWEHIWVTVYETIVAFFVTGVVSVFISILIYRNPSFDKIIDPYLTIFNSLPKVALGPILIIWVGANTRSIILMAVLISLVVSIQSISVGFKNTNKNRIKILKVFGASDFDILRYAVIPSNYKIIVNTFKINIGLSLIGVVMGEFLTSKAGIGYLILYGSQVFNLTLVMSGIVILLVISLLFYGIISLIEKHLDY